MLLADVIDNLRIFAVLLAITQQILTIYICIAYFRAVYLYRYQGLLLWHVISISIAYLFNLDFATVEMIGRIGQDYTWRLPVTLISSMFGTSALIFMVANVTYIKRTYRNRHSQQGRQ